MLFAISLIILIISLYKDRSRYRNCYLFMFTFVIAVMELLWALGKVSSVLPVILMSFVILLVLMTPGMLIANGVLMINREGKSLANLLSMLMGIGIGVGELCGIIFVVLFSISTLREENASWMNVHANFFLILFFICISAIYFSVSFLSFMMYTIFLQTIPRKRDFDYIIIHGAGLIGGNKVSKLLADRLDKAIAVYNGDPTPPMMIPSGGKGSDEAISEAAAMAGYLIEHGIPREKIILEDRSTTTRENLLFSKDIIECQEGPKYTALVTSNYHMYRALRYCRKIGLKCTGIGSRVALYYWPSALIREYVAIHKEPKHLITLLLGWIIFVGLPLVIMLLS